MISSSLMWLLITHWYKSLQYLLSLHYTTIGIRVVDPLYRKSSWQWVQAVCPVVGAAMKVSRACGLWWPSWNTRSFCSKGRLPCERDSYLRGGLLEYNCEVKSHNILLKTCKVYPLLCIMMVTWFHHMKW